MHIKYFSPTIYSLFFTAAFAHADGKLSVDAQEKIQQLKNPTTEQISEIKKHSELTTSELLEDLPQLAINPTDPARHARSTATPNGALYVDVYQESRVLIDYTGNGNVIEPMSFAVVYKYLRDRSGNVVPHFVRAQLVSTGRAGFETSIGEFDIDSRHRYWYSHTYNSEMDYAQFFIGGIALHQTEEDAYVKLGGPASHGCVRHHEFDAIAMWNLVGDALDAGNTVNVKVFPFSAPVILADGSSGQATDGFGGLVNQWINNDIECTRRGHSENCTKSWIAWE